MIDINKLIGIGVTLLLVGFFAGIEIAFVSANKLSIELKKKQGLRSGRILSQFMESPAKFGGQYLTYVLWAIPPDGRPVNLGEVVLNESNHGEFDD